MDILNNNILQDQSKLNKFNNIIKVGYTIIIYYYYFDENNKKKTTFSEGIIIKKTSNSFTIKISIQHILLEQIFPLNLPNIISIKKIKSIKIKRANLYHLK